LKKTVALGSGPVTKNYRKINGKNNALLQTAILFKPSQKLHLSR